MSEALTKEGVAKAKKFIAEKRVLYENTRPFVATEDPDWTDIGRVIEFYEQLLATIEARDGEIAELTAECKAHCKMIDLVYEEVDHRDKQIAKLQACLWELVYNADNTDWDYEWCQGEHNELIARARKLSKGKELAESGEEVRDDEA